MGYTSHKKLGNESHLRFLRRTGSYFVGSKWAGPTPEVEFQIIALHPGRGGVYGVIRETDSIKNTERQFALIIKLETLRGVTQYKAMTETDDPQLAHMPDFLFRRLTPVDQLGYPEDDAQRCKNWRARCQKLIDTQKALQPGVRFTASEGVQFSEGLITEFEVVDPRSRIFLATSSAGKVFRVQLKLHHIDEMEFTVHE